MKTILCLPAFAMFGFFYLNPKPLNLTFGSQPDDSARINHILDGSTDEWASSGFKTDNATAIQYATDNDSKDLFLVMNIPDVRTQLKMMRMGMSLYIDLKGKKKESRGIEFPVKNENTYMNNQGFSGTRTSGQNDDQSSNREQRKFDFKTMRQLLVLNLIQMKVFGFSNDEPDDQQLLLPGSANIAFSWDSADVMHIEYLIPLSMLGDVASLNQKDISIGWNIHAFEMPQRNDGSTNSSIGNQSSGRGGGIGGARRSGSFSSGSGGRPNQADMEKMMEDQKFWTKYVINIPSGEKAF